MIEAHEAEKGAFKFSTANNFQLELGHPASYYCENSTKYYSTIHTTVHNRQGKQLIISFSVLIINVSIAIYF